MVLAGGTLFAATSGTIVLQGTVPVILEVIVTTDPAAGSLDLSQNVTDVLVGTVVERSNKKAGYTVTIDSTNAVNAGSNVARFESADPANLDTLDFTISYGGVPVALSSGSATVSDQVVKTAAAGNSNEVRISYDGTTAFMYEDAYTDTLTFTITAK